MRSLISIALLALCGTAWAAGDDFTYKGVMVGDTQEVLLEKLPTYRCVGSTCYYSRDSCIDRGRSGSACDSATTFGGAWIKTGQIKLIDGKVAEMALMFTQTMVSNAADAVTQAYGPPKSETTKELQTRSGAKYPSWEKTWVRGSKSLTIHQRAGDIETGMVLITSVEAQAASDQMRQDQATKGAKDF